MRDDFDVPEEKLKIVKAGVTREQIDKYRLPPMNFAKELSSSRDWFVSRNGGDETVWELEALDPADMLADLECAVQNVIDIDLFNHEAALWKNEDTPFINAAAAKCAAALKDLIN